MARKTNKRLSMTALDLLCSQNDLREAEEFVYFYNGQAYATDGIAVARIPLSKMGFSIGEAIQMHGIRVHRLDYYTLRSIVGKILEVSNGFIKGELKRGKSIVHIPYKNDNLNCFTQSYFDEKILGLYLDEPPVYTTKFNFKHIMLADMVMGKDDKRIISLREKTLIIESTNSEIFITKVL